MKRLFVVLALTILFGGANAYAADIKSDCNGIVVQGAEMEPDRKIAVIIVYPDKNLNNVDGGKADDIVAYTGIANTNSNGFFTLAIGMKDDCEYGVYNLLYGEKQQEFYYASVSDKNNAVNELCSGDSERIRICLDNELKYYSVCGKQSEAYKKYYSILPRDGKIEVCKLLAAVPYSGNISATEDFFVEFDKTLLQKSINGFETYGVKSIAAFITNENTAQTLIQYNDVLKLDFEKINTESTSLMQLIYQNILSNTSMTTVQFANKCYELAAVDDVNQLTKHNAGTLTDIISRYSEQFGNILESSGFNALSGTQKTVAMIKIADSSKYATIDDVKNNIIKAVAEAKNSQAATLSSSSGGGGGGGGSSFPGIIETAPITNIATNESDNSTPMPSGEPAKAFFTDIAAYGWAKDAIEHLAEIGIVNGVDEIHFMPGANITREAFLAMALRSYSIPLTSSKTKFSDVDEQMWYAEYVNTASELGIVNGRDDGSFGIGDNIIRQDAAVILNNIMNYAGAEQENKETDITFDDADIISDYAKTAVDKLSALKIINGIEGRFEAFKHTTRAETAVMIHRMIEKE